MKRALAALALLPLTALADTCVTVDGQTICRPPDEFFCDDAYTRICTNDRDISTCRCELKNPPRPLFPPSLCEVRLVYTSTNPQGVLDATPANQSGCDAAGAELAIATALAKRLGLRLSPSSSD